MTDHLNPILSRASDKATLSCRAKKLELQGWNYPRHLAGRLFSVIVHGDTEGAEVLRRSLTDWLLDMHLLQAGHAATIDRYIGYYEPYATSHDALDRDQALHAEVRNATKILVEAIRLVRSGEVVRAPTAYGRGSTEVKGVPNRRNAATVHVSEWSK